MLTLSKATKETKLLLKWGGILAGSFLVLFLLFKVGVAVKNQFFPDPKPPPTVGFGILKPIDFPKNQNTLPEITYTLDTLSGSLPNFDDRAKVFKIIKPEPNILALKRAQEKLSSVGFRGAPHALSDSLYQWTDTSELSRKISLDIYSLDITMSSNFLNNKTVQNAADLGNENSAIATTEDFLIKMDLLPEDVEKAKTKTSFFSIDNGQLKPATSLSNSQVLRVDFFQKDIENTPIYYPHHPFSIMNFLVGSGQNDPLVIGGNFSYRKIGQASHTYPIKTAQEAFDDLQNKKGYILPLDDKLKEVSIKNVSLGYYLSEKSENLLPIIVFEGNNNFWAFIEAIKDEWIEK